MQQETSAHMLLRMLCHTRWPKYWFHRFRQGDFNVEDRPRSGRPSTIDTRRLQALIQTDATRTTRSLANELETSHSTVERHLHELGMQFHVDRWVYVGVPGTSAAASTPAQQAYDSAASSANVPTPATSTTSSSSSWTQSPATNSQHTQQPPSYW
ncbi:Histone-lysine N-methyltransferase SETMAR-like protein [Aphelenchoides bicaudatus]|nr:Histone-lysine N-methyltransferase SETMAR-like protein [Aphelenchoides bicaudatus]